MTGTSAS
ncbi:hypothetical protein F383_37687 [Gossypium arboreum]|nr:hypothetical protein F383_37687 [Gossypium arboreum]